MSKDIRKRMSVKHEEWVADLFGVRVNPGSGNQFNRPMDGRVRREASALGGLAWDCKATLGKSMSIPLTMIDKAIEQARNEWPMLSLRFYKGEDLRSFIDWFAVPAELFMDLWDKAHAPCENCGATR